MVGTGLLQAGYFLFLQSGYRLGDLSLVYPVGPRHRRPAGRAGRHRAAWRAARAGRAGRHRLRHSRRSCCSVPPGWQTAGQPLAQRRGRWPSRWSPACSSPSYTLWDKYAVSTLQTPAAAAGVRGVAGDGPGAGPVRAAPAGAHRAVWRTYRRQVAGAAVLAPLAYILVLVALSFTAVSAVAPAREVSVLVGVLLGRRLLGEGQPGPPPGRGRRHRGRHHLHRRRLAPTAARAELSRGRRPRRSPRRAARRRCGPSPRRRARRTGTRPRTATAAGRRPASSMAWKNAA